MSVVMIFSTGGYRCCGAWSLYSLGALFKKKNTKLLI